MKNEIELVEGCHVVTDGEEGATKSRRQGNI
jgi:hypothetical protein